LGDQGQGQARTGNQCGQSGFCSTHKSLENGSDERTRPSWPIHVTVMWRNRDSSVTKSAQPLVLCDSRVTTHFSHAQNLAPDQAGRGKRGSRIERHLIHLYPSRPPQRAWPSGYPIGAFGEIKPVPLRIIMSVAK
jgi:hypothetical protein